jgi:hypothetical protein
MSPFSAPWSFHAPDLMPAYFLLSCSANSMLLLDQTPQDDAAFAPVSYFVGGG